MEQLGAASQRRQKLLNTKAEEAALLREPSPNNA
jgi:hypothetical protein